MLVEEVVHFSVTVGDVHAQEVIAVVEGTCNTCPNRVNIFEHCGILRTVNIVVAGGVEVAPVECRCDSLNPIGVQAGKCKVAQAFFSYFFSVTRTCDGKIIVDMDA